MVVHSGNGVRRKESNDLLRGETYGSEALQNLVSSIEWLRDEEVRRLALSVGDVP
jgi:hypothetical protein